MRLFLRAASRTGGAGGLAVLAAFHAARGLRGAFRLLFAAGGAASDNGHSANERDKCDGGFHFLV